MSLTAKLFMVFESLVKHTFISPKQSLKATALCFDSSKTLRKATDSTITIATSPQYITLITKHGRYSIYSMFAELNTGLHSEKTRLD